ncbi:MAG: gliding motility-associated C-terminal domain-containing protein [Bacteroidota bacterium]
MKLYLSLLICFLLSYHLNAQSKFYYGEQTQGIITSTNVDGSNPTPIIFNQQILRRIRADYENGHLYWVEGGTGTIWRANSDGSDMTKIIDLTTNNLNTIELDFKNQQILFTITNDGTIKSADLDGTNIQNVVTDVGNIQGIAYDANCDKLYWTDFGEGKVLRANIDGTNKETLLTTNTKPFDIVLDVYNRHLFFTDRLSESIYKANLDGSNLQVIVATPGVKGSLSIDLLNSRLYWVNNDLELVQSANLDGSNITTMAMGTNTQHLAGISVENTSQSFTNLPNLNLGNDTTLCEGASLTLSVDNNNFVNFSWQDGNMGNTKTITQQGTYWVEAQTIEGCSASDTINVSYDIPLLDLGNDTTLCEGASLTLSADNNHFVNFSWQDGSMGSTKTITQQGTYWVEAQTIEGCSASDTINVSYDIPLLNLGNDTTLCEGTSLTLSADNNHFVNFLWQDGSIGSTKTITQQGTYWIEAQTVEGCSASDTINVSYDGLSFNLGNDTTLCEGASLTIGQSFLNATSYLWQDGTTTPTYQIESSGLYIQEVLFDDGCSFTDSINVDYVNSTLFDIGQDTSLCVGDSVLIGYEFPGANYLWENGLQEPYRWVNQSGLYVQELILDNCSRLDSILIDFVDLLTIELGEDTTICQGESLFLEVDPSGTSYTWQDSTSNPYLIVQDSGLYAVTVSNDACVVKDSLFVEVLDCSICNLYIPNVFSPNGDGVNDFFQVYSNCLFDYYELKIFNRWGALLYEGNHISSRWDGRFRNEDAPVDVYTYFLIYAFGQGQDFSKKIKKGDITILR